MPEQQNTTPDPDVPKTLQALETLEKRHPKLSNLMHRIYRWRILYGIAGFLSGIIKSIIEMIIGSQN